MDNFWNNSTYVVNNIFSKFDEMTLYLMLKSSDEWGYHGSQTLSRGAGWVYSDMAPGSQALQG